MTTFHINDIGGDKRMRRSLKLGCKDFSSIVRLIFTIQQAIMFLLLVIVDAQISPHSGLLCRRGEEAFFFIYLLVLQPLRWCCVDCVINHERDVREE